MPKGFWKPLTEEQEQYILDNYMDIPMKPLAESINITFGRVKRFLNKKGLSIPKEIIEKRKLIGQRKKGDVPFNKGLKQSEYMTKEAIERTKDTRFKKGNIPHNTMYDGHETVSKDGYIKVRVSLGNYELKHRLVYENNCGPVPEGYIIVFKDGNKLNCSIENLELISREENMLRNSKHQINPEVIPSLALVNQIKNKVNNYGKE